MKGSKVFCIVGLLSAVAFITGCTSLVPVSEHSSFPADSSTYRILGRVTVDSSTTDSGYVKLIEAAKRQYPEADDVVNIVVDSKQTTFFFIFHFNSYVMSGIAIDYK